VGSTSTEIDLILGAMAALLADFGEASWAAALTRLQQQYQGDPAATAGAVVAAFGGMGSLNDIVLYRDANVATAATESLDNLRHRLFAMCRGAA
jgi:hypothetical protein